MEKVVIVGTGQAGVQTAFSLRDEGFEGSITLVGDEAATPYQRPPLSKGYLLGKLDEDGVLLKARHLYESYRLDMRLGVRASAINRAARQVELEGGERLAYDHLVLATGARQRVLDVPGAQLPGVLILRTIEDARALMAQLRQVRRAVVVGGGFIGLEFAAVARAKGIEVLVVEVAPRPMGRALSAEMSQFFEQRHVQWGVRFLFGVGVAEVLGAGRARGVRLTDGSVIETDLVLVGVGVLPNDELAVAAGLDVANGILVDDQMRTSDPAISAVGDCAAHPSRFAQGEPVRIESVQNATDQARAVAAALMGRPAPYDAVPWFWSDQGDLKLQIAGLGSGHDVTAIRGDPAGGAFSVFCFKAGRLMAVESVNRGPDHVMARRLIGAGTAITPEQAADETVPLKTYLAAAAPARAPAV